MYSPEDHAILEAEYQRNPKPDKTARANVVSRVSLGEKEVQVRVLALPLECRFSNVTIPRYGSKIVARMTVGNRNLFSPMNLSPLGRAWEMGRLVTIMCLQNQGLPAGWINLMTSTMGRSVERTWVTHSRPFGLT